MTTRARQAALAPLLAGICVLAGQAIAADPVPDLGEPRAGAYTLDRAHASLVMRVDHLGFSNYTLRFRDFDAKLHFDPKQPQDARLEATIEVASLETDYPDRANLDFNAVLTGPQWLDAAKHPQILYRSTRIVPTADGRLKVEGELTMRGITRPLALDARYNGGWGGMQLDPHSRIGFSAKGTLPRSEFGITYGLPPPGTRFGVGDAVEFAIEVEFTGPPWP